MAENKYLAGWAFLQGGLETLHPLIAILPSEKVAEGVAALIVAARQIIDGGQTELRYFPDELDKQSPRGSSRGETPEPGIGGTTSSVFFPFGMEHGSIPEPTEEDIEAMLNRRNGIRDDGDS